MKKNNIYTFVCLSAEDIKKQSDNLNLLVQKALRAHNKVGLSAKSFSGLSAEKYYFFKDYNDHYYVKIKEKEVIIKAKNFLKTLSDISGKDKKSNFKNLVLHLQYSHNSPYSHTRHKTPNYYQVYFNLKPPIFVKKPTDFKGENSTFYEDGLVRIDVTGGGHIVGINWNLPIIQEIKIIEINELALPLEIAYTYLEELNTLSPYFYSNDKLIMPIKVEYSPYIIQPITEFIAENYPSLGKGTAI
jgi:hypothetical protein